MDALFDITPTARPARREVPALPGDAVQGSLFGDADVVVARKHTARAPREAIHADRDRPLFALDTDEHDGQTAATDELGALLAA